MESLFTNAWNTQPEPHQLLSTYQTVSPQPTNLGVSLSYRANYLDLDPTYRDAYGQLLLRMTFDFGVNEQRMSDFLTEQCAKIAKSAGPSSISIERRTGPYSIVPY